MQLKDKLMLITGASSGIGAATAREAARRGVRVILVARSSDKLEQLAVDIRKEGGQAYVYPADVTDPKAVQELASQVAAELGTPDIVFNNAGIGRWQFIEETSMEDGARMMAAPYNAAFYVTRAFLPGMLARNSGTVANITSLGGYMTWPGASGYHAARWAMRGFTEGLRADLHGTRVRTLMATFAKVNTEYWENNPGSESGLPRAQKMIPVLSAEATAKAILFALRWDLRFISAPLMAYIILFLNYLFPGITRALLFSTGRRRSIGSTKTS